MPEASPQGRRPDWNARRALLLGRLFQGLDDARAEAVRRDLRRRGPEAVTSALEAASKLQRVTVTDLNALSRAGRRLLCLLPGGRTVLVEAAGERGWHVDPGDGGAPRRVRSSALSPLLPCEGLVPVVGAPAPGASMDGRSPAVAVYLRLMVQLLGLTTPIAMMLIIDKVVSQGARDTLMALVLGVASLTLFQYLFSLAHACLASRQAEVDALPARREVLAALLDSSTGPAWSSPGWDAVQSCPEAGRFRAETRPQMVADCLHLMLLAVLMACFSAVLLAVSLVFLPLYVAVESWGNRRAGPHAAVSGSLRNQLSTHFLESVAAGATLRAMALEDHVLGHWDALDGRLAGARYRSTLYRRLSVLGVEFLQRVSVIVIMLLGVSAVLAGAMTLGQYIAFNLLSMQLAQPALRLAGYRRARADHRLQDRARRRLEDDCRAHAWPAPGDRHAAVLDSPVLSVDGLAAVSGETPTGLSFVLTGGDWLGVVGRSGCGKSTLLRTLAGLERPGRGLAVFNGVPIPSMERLARSRRIRLVPQDPVVFSATIAENIRLGDPAAAPAQIVTAAHVCGLGGLLARLPDHLDTVVGAAGRSLSGGERQRIAIARAILSRPDVLLLDEATAALDAQSEAALLASLRGWLPGTAVVVVSHRPSTLAGCRRVISLDSGSSDTPERGRSESVEVLRAAMS